MKPRCTRFLPLSAVLLPILLVALLAAAGCGDDSEDLPTGRPIVVISVDTLRSDRLPAYGYDAVDTPAIDALRSDGILYRRAYSPVPMTMPAHASLLTGLLPPDHGLRDNAGYRLEEDVGPTVPELLGRAGYATGAAVSAFVMRAESGLDRGFDHYDDDVPQVERTLMGGLQRPGEETAEAALAWLSGLDGGEQPFFLLFHIYEPHTPREPPEPFASRYADPYDGEVAHADAIVGGLLDALRERGLYDGTTIILLSDHGEGLMDHGEDEHGILLYRESLQVPMIVKLPEARLAGTAVDAPVQLTDVTATILELAGVEAPEALDAVSLLRFTEGEDLPPELTDRVLYAETFHPFLRFGWSELTSVVRGDHHYIEGVDRELYDLEDDPAERHNLVREDRRTYAALRDALRQFDSDLELPFEEQGETRQALAALGYLGSTTTADAEGPLPDPKQKISALQPLRDGISAVHGRDYETAIPLLRRAAEEVPRSIDAWQFLGLAYQEADRPRDAFAAYQEAFDLSNGAPHLAKPLARLALRLQRWEDASAYLELLIEEEPGEPGLRLLQARAQLFAGDLDGAFRSARRAAELAPESPDARYLLGAVHMGRRELDAAEASFRRALELAPRHPPSLNDLAVLLMSEGRREEAAALLERLLEVQPENAAARQNLERLRG